MHVTDRTARHRYERNTTMKRSRTALAHGVVTGSPGRDNHRLSRHGHLEAVRRHHAVRHLE
jgi:hypothetical protein